MVRTRRLALRLNAQSINTVGPAETERYSRRLYKLAIRLEREMGSPQDIEWAVKGNKVYILQSRPITTLLGWDPVPVNPTIA